MFGRHNLSFAQRVCGVWDLLRVSSVVKKRGHSPRTGCPAYTGQNTSWILCTCCHKPSPPLFSFILSSLSSFFFILADTDRVLEHAQHSARHSLSNKSWNQFKFFLWFFTFPKKETLLLYFSSFYSFFRDLFLSKTLLNRFATTKNTKS